MLDDVVRIAQCPLCHGSDFARLNTPGHWIGGGVFAPVAKELGICQCRACGLIFNNPRPGAALLDRFYGGHDYSCHKVAYSAAIVNLARHLHRTVSAYLPFRSGLRLLDYGCGGGGILYNLKAMGWDAQGYEVGQAGVQSCRDIGLPVATDLDLLPERSFDAVVLNHVFEHISDPKPVLRRIASLVSDQGRIFVATPNAASLRAILSPPFCSRHLNFDERYRAFPIHLFHYTPDTLPRMVQEAGLTVVDTITYGVGLENLFAKEETPLETADFLEKETGPSPQPAQAASPAPPPSSGLKGMIKSVLFRYRLGDSVMVVASSHGG